MTVREQFEERVELGIGGRPGVTVERVNTILQSVVCDFVIGDRLQDYADDAIATSSVTFGGPSYGPLEKRTRLPPTNDMAVHLPSTETATAAEEVAEAVVDGDETFYVAVRECERGDAYSPHIHVADEQEASLEDVSLLLERAVEVVDA